MAAQFDLKKSSNGKFFFSLKAGNGQVIGQSQMYSSEATRDAGIESVKTNAPGAAVNDLTSA
ncbi:YegP family protein [Brachymonas denitrificans]|uniref:YegP family protein n=1 Tax=Brachymonas denitrificans TaxID=28220 RepID=UPI002AFE8C46|nr:YegP family protein [Brachymonas denitrificans]